MIYREKIQQGLRARQSGSRDEALRLFKEAISNNPDEIQAYREAGIECRALGFLNEALDFFSEALMRLPDDFVTLGHWALCQRDLGREELCLQQLMLLAEINSANGWICNELGITLKKIGRLTEAKQWFLKALTILPTNTHALMEFGFLARKMGERELSLAQFEAVIELQKTHVGAYIEAATELQVLGRDGDALQMLHQAVARIPNNIVLAEQRLSLLFNIEPVCACYDLLLRAAYFPIGGQLVKRFFSSLLLQPGIVEALNGVPIKMFSGLLSQSGFIEELLHMAVVDHNAFLKLLGYLEPSLVKFMQLELISELNEKLFILLVLLSWYGKNAVAENFVKTHINSYIGYFSFGEWCLVTKSLRSLVSDSFVLELIAKAALEKNSIVGLLLSLIMLSNYPQEPSLRVFADRDALIRILRPYCTVKNEPILKNIFLHLLQRQFLTIAEIQLLYDSESLLADLQVMTNKVTGLCKHRERDFSVRRPLKVALCLSGQLRGYKEAFPSIKSEIIDVLQPDIFIHTWQDIGFKEPVPTHADRVFKGHFLIAYKKLFSTYGYSYPDIKNKLPSLFELMPNASVRVQELKRFYGTESVIVENDAEPPFHTYSNAQKMFYKIVACNEMVEQSGNDYDLIIRLRPDKKVVSGTTTDWFEIAYEYQKDKLLYLDKPWGLDALKEWGTGVFAADDQIAICSQNAMNYYSALPLLEKDFIDHNFAFFAKPRGNHSLLAHGIFVGGFCKPFKFSIQGGELMNIRLDAKDILFAVKQDQENLDKEIFDELISALEKDIV